jgi:hypothetical protein
VACLALPYFSTLPHKRNDFRKPVIQHKKCVLIFSKIFVWSISHYYKKNWAKCYNNRTYIAKSCQILMKLVFSRHIFEKCSNVKFHGHPSSCNGPVRGGWTDMTRLIVTFRNFANVRENYGCRTATASLYVKVTFRHAQRQIWWNHKKHQYGQIPKLEIRTWYIWNANLRKQR